MLLQRYLARAVLLRAAVALPALALVYLGVALLEQGHAGGRWSLAAIHLALLRLPLIVVQVAPVALMLGAALAIVALRGRGELEALAALGAAPPQLWTPVLLAGLLFAAGTLAVDELVVPPSERAIDARRGGRVVSPLTGLSRRAAWFRLGRWLYHVDGDRVMALELGPEFRAVRRVDATGGDGVVETRLGEHVPSSPPPDLTRARKLSGYVGARAEALDYASLSRRLSQLERAGQRRPAERLVLHSKLAYPALNVVVALLACLLLRQRPRTPVGTLAAAMSALLLLWLALATGWVLARAGWVVPALGVWGPVGAAFLLAAALLAVGQRRRGRRGSAA